MPHAFSTSIAGLSWSSAEAGGEAPTLSPAASSRVRPGSASASSSNIVASCPAPPTGTARPSIVAVVGSSWPWKSFSPMIEIGVTCRPRSSMSRRTTPWLRSGAGTPSRNAAVGARSMLRTPRTAPRSIALAAGEERRPHVGVAREVLHVRHVAVLAEERRERELRAGRRRVELVRRRGEHDEVAGPGGMRHVGRAVRPVRDVARLRLRVRAVDRVPALGRAVPGPVVRVLERLERRADLRDGRRLLVRRDLLQAAARRIAVRRG